MSARSSFVRLHRVDSTRETLWQNGPDPRRRFIDLRLPTRTTTMVFIGPETRAIDLNRVDAAIR